MEHLLRRFPNNEARLAYETTVPTTKQISKTDYDICFAIPYGKKAFLWHTFDGDRKVAVLIEINRENVFGLVTFLSEGSNNPEKTRDFELGTIVSGVIYEEEEKEIDERHKVFVVDDIHMYRGHQLARKTFREKSGYLFDFLQNQRYDIPIVLPVFWNTNAESLHTKVEIPYTVRHYQYRSSSRILPHLCMSIIKKPGSLPVPVVRPPPSFLESENSSQSQSHSLVRRFQMNWRFDFSKPAYRKTAFFYVRADTMFDVYFLGALQENTIVYCQNALVLNYKTSVFLNGVFRDIRENANIDAIEESDDESDFEDVRENKYVDLEKEVVMECSFHYKFRKWMPFRVAANVQANATVQTQTKDPREKVTSIFSLYTLEHLSSYKK